MGDDHSNHPDDGFRTLCANDPDLAALRASIREFVRADRDEFGWRPTVDCWFTWDEGFSTRLGKAGFLGMTIPRRYGGVGKGHLHRYVVTEELLASGAPVAAHWIADRQIAPALLGYGSPEQRNDLLPKIASGRFYIAVALSEHGAGSDLAAAQTKATKTEGGWLLNGTKVWTSGAHHAHLIVVFARTAPLDTAHRHAGFSQFLVAPDAAGLTISPIELMSGEHHFNEILLQDVFVPDNDVFGEIGNGWHQVTAELSFERSGPERILTTFPLIRAAIQTLDKRVASDPAAAADIGHLMAHLISLRQMSISVARALAAGVPAANQAALVKDLGTRFEQNSVELIDELLDHVPHLSASDPELSELMNQAWLHKPVFTLRGGTNEILRSMVARGMGLR
jgi:alkylation response protein AidB-like acyl-CoA dehydrogenase